MTEPQRDSGESMFCPPIRAFASLDMIADFIVLAMLFVFGLRERVQIATRKI